jgi:heme exporter protein B
VRPPGFFRATGIVAAKDLRIEWRTLETTSATVTFSLAVLVIFNFAFGLGTVKSLGVENLLPGVLWTTLLFASIVAMIRSLHTEQLRDTLTAQYQAPVDRGALFAGKMLANLAKLTALQWILLPLTALFFDYDVASSAPTLLLVLFLHGLGLAELGTLFAAVSSRLGRGEALLATLLFPAASPLLISAVKCTAAVLDGRGIASAGRWLGVAVGFDLLYLFVALLTFEYVLEE